MRWAADEADIRDAELVALMAWGYLDQHPVPGHEGFDLGYGQADAEEAATQYVARALGPQHRLSPCRRCAIYAAPRGRRRRRSRSWAPVVSAASGPSSGSRMQRCLNETTVPLVLVHEAHLGDPSGPLVVGVDGSDNAAAAFRWAHAEARRRGAHLKALYAWQEPMGGGESFGLVVDDAARSGGGGHGGEGRDVRRRCRPVPVERVAGEDELHLSSSRSRRRPPWSSATVDTVAGAAPLSASVAQQVAHHSRCPVVVVPIPA